jgi:response regulator RpfG family c-di-GMP phosphodiesterase
VNNTGFDDITPIDRAPAIGATASLMSLMTSIGNPTQIFLCAMIADLGLLELPPSALKIVMEGLFDDLKGEALDLYQKHPLYSVNLVRSRKLPLDEKTKNIILSTHEKINGRGFPAGLEKEKIPLEAQIIHLAELMDKALKVQEGKQREDPALVRRQFLEDISQQEIFSLDLILKISKELG